MKLEIIRDTLTSALLKVGRVAEKHPSLPILSCVFFSAKRGGVTLRATNLDLGIEYLLPARVGKEGAAAVPAGPLTSYVSSLSAGKTVELELSDGKLLVSAGATHARLSTAPPDEFPTIPKAEGAPASVGPAELLRGFRAVSYAGALGNLKPELGSVYLYQENGDLFFVATDSFRLAEKRVTVKKEVLPRGALIPIRNVTEMCKLFESEERDIEMRFGKGQVSFSGAGFLITSRLLEGTFPDYRQIIPKESTTEAVSLKEDVFSALKTTAIFSGRFNQLHIKILPKEKMLEFETRNNDVGESAFRIGAALTGAPLEANFNHRYIQDCLPAIEGDSVVFKWSGENKPLLISGMGDRSFRYLVMPMNR